MMVRIVDGGLQDVNWRRVFEPYSEEELSYFLNEAGRLATVSPQHATHALTGWKPKGKLLFAVIHL
jgi:hypothetical protein